MALVILQKLKEDCSEIKEILKLNFCFESFRILNKPRCFAKTIEIEFKQLLYE